MSGFEARLERLGLKYLVDERTAGRIRREIAPYCRADTHSQAALRRGDVGYAITSLYLDSPGLAFHQAKERGDSDRIKLRIRTYDDTSPAILEVKRRSSDIVDKSRARVSRELAERVARGDASPARADTSDARFAESFALLAARHGADRERGLDGLMRRSSRVMM